MDIFIRAVMSKSLLPCLSAGVAARAWRVIWSFSADRLTFAVSFTAMAVVASPRGTRYYYIS